MFTKEYSLIRKFVFVLALLSLFSIGAQVFAEQQEASGQEELFEMPLEELMKIEVDTVYGASRYEQKTTQAPASVTIITADDIRNYGYRTLADILRSAVGFYTSYDRSYERIGVRGFSLPGDENTRVLILLDGNRLNENVRGHGAIGKEFILDVDLIDRVEIIRGPGSSLYGGNAIFGVINIITKKGRDFDGFELSGDLAVDDATDKFGAEKGRVTFGKEFDDGMDFLISGTLYGRDGRSLIIPKFSVVEGHGPTSNDDEKFYQLFTKLSGGNLTFEAAYSSRDKVIPTAPLGAVFEQQFQQRKEDAFGFAQLTYNREFSDTFSMLARASYNYAKHRRPLWYAGITAFRPPTMYELYYEDAYLSQTPAGTLESETIETYEAVLEHYFKPDLRGSLSVFHYQLHDSIDRIDMEDTWENRSTIKALGFEAELQKKWASGMTGRVSYSLVDTGSDEVPTFERMEEDGEVWQEFAGYKPGKILNSPSHLFKLNLLAPLVKDKVFAGFETQYTSGRKTILGGKTAGSFVANLTLNFLNITEGMDCSFGIYNLFNQSYVEPAWADNELETIPQDGRWFMFNLRYRF